LRQLIGSYGFDRADLEVNHNPAIAGRERRRADIAMFRPGAERANENLQRIIVCKSQRRRDKLRSLIDAENDLRA
jgi:type I restriction enzyme M protein